MNEDKKSSQDESEERAESARNDQNSLNRPERLRHSTHQRRKTPTGYNGIHRRRNKRLSW